MEICVKKFFCLRIFSCQLKCSVKKTIVCTFTHIVASSSASSTVIDDAVIYHPFIKYLIPNYSWAYAVGLFTLPTYQVAEGFALRAATASFSLRFTVPLSAAEHFSVAGPRVWNCLPPEVMSAPSLTTFCTRLKTFLFTESYSDIWLIWHFCLHTV